ncbi:MAG: hypothetical protein L0K90_05040 [Staphylococcus equorum]|nr:hypothetical protein [Staphylococcus equorum]
MANNYGGKFTSFDEYLNQHSVRQDRQSYPFYTDNADYNTNSKSYYDDLARKAKLIEILAKRIWEYDEELAKRFEEWDKNLEEFPEDVENLLIEWLENGTLEDIINDNIFNKLNNKIDTIKGITAELKEKDVKQDSAINAVDNKVSGFRTELNNKINDIVSPDPVGYVDTVDDLNSQYPSGADGVVVVNSDGHWYYYSGGSWEQGGEYMTSNIHPILSSDGNGININYRKSWIDNPDITSLESGIYTVFLQSSLSNDNYPVAVNIPEEIEHDQCLVKVFRYGDGQRADYEIVVNYSGKVWRSQEYLDGTLREWGEVIINKDSKPIQEYRMTYPYGDIFPLSYGHEDIKTSSLTVPITELNTGFYYGQISSSNIENPADYNLPDDIIYSSTYTFIVYHNYDDRVSILLHDNFSQRSWICYNRTNTTQLVWKRLDKQTNEFEKEKYNFAFRANEIRNDNYKSLVIADTHVAHLANSSQIGDVNPINMDDFFDIDKRLRHQDTSVHLGDWIDGNMDKPTTTTSVIKYTSEFYSKPHRFGVIGNHDYNPQWNGFSGENGKYKYDLERVYSKGDMLDYFVPFRKDYYKVDLDDKKVRLIFLNAFDISYKTDNKGELLLDPLQTISFGSQQVQWFIDTLQSVPEDYNVVIYTHDTFDNVFRDATVYNGDTIRKVAEAYQSKGETGVFTSDITETSEVYDYYSIDTTANFENANGRILAVLNGHIHRDDTILRQGIRYISLLCGRAQSGSTEEKPPRDIRKPERNAISYLEFDLPNEKINLLRYGAGIDRTFNMFK